MKSKKFKGFFEEVKRFGLDIDYLKDFIYDYKIAAESPRNSFVG